MRQPSSILPNAQPTPAPQHGTQGHGGGAAMVSDAVTPMSTSPQEALTACMAVGSTFGQALGQVASTLGADAGEVLLRAQMASRFKKGAIREWQDVLAVVAWLDDVAQVMPDAARAWLEGLGKEIAPGVNKLLKGALVHDQVMASLKDVGRISPVTAQQWMGIYVQDLNRRSGKNLAVSKQDWLVEIPVPLVEDMTVYVDDCPNFRRLPGGVQLNHLQVTGCPKWDGIIPEDVSMSGILFTDAFPNRRGTTLDAYRQWFAACRELDSLTAACRADAEAGRYDPVQWDDLMVRMRELARMPDMGSVEGGP